MYDEAAATLTGRRSRLSFRLAQEVEARLAEATPITGGLLFHLMQGVPAAGRHGQAGRRSRPR